MRLPCPLTGVDFEALASESGSEYRSMTELIDEFKAVRAATLGLFDALPLEDWTRTGLAGGNRISARSIAYALAGHELHHLADLRFKLAASPFPAVETVILR